MKKTKIISFLLLSTTVVMLTSSCGLRLPNFSKQDPQNTQTVLAASPSVESTPISTPFKEQPFVELRKAFVKLEEAKYLKNITIMDINSFGQKTHFKSYIEGDSDNKNIYIKRDYEQLGITYTSNFYTKDSYVYMLNAGYDKYIKKAYSTEKELYEALSISDTDEIFGDSYDENNSTYSQETVKIVGEETVKVNNVDIKTSSYKLTLPEDKRQKYIDDNIISLVYNKDADYTIEEDAQIKKVIDGMKVNKLEILFYLDTNGSIVKTLETVDVEFVDNDDLHVFENVINNKIVYSLSTEIFDYDVQVVVDYPAFTVANTISWEDFLALANEGSST